MYLGDCEGKLSHDNVASVMNASELLQIEDLKQRCIEYLEHILDQKNYQEVVKLAEQFNEPQLKMKVCALPSLRIFEFLRFG